MCGGEREKNLQGCNGLDDLKGCFQFSSVILCAFSPQVLSGLPLDESLGREEDGVGVVCENLVFQTTSLFWRRQRPGRSLLHRTTTRALHCQM